MRLTEKKENGFYKLKEGQEIYGEENGIRLVQIVGQLEDIEDELGIRLATLFKALKQGHIWVKKKGEVISSCDYNLGLTGTTYDLYCKDVGEWLLVKDYGKTWALTRGELL